MRTGCQGPPKSWAKSLPEGFPAAFLSGSLTYSRLISEVLPATINSLRPLPSSVRRSGTSGLYSLCINMTAELAPPICISEPARKYAKGRNPKISQVCSGTPGILTFGKWREKGQRLRVTFKLCSEFEVSSGYLRSYLNK